MSVGPSGLAVTQGLSDIKVPQALSEIISYAALLVPELQAAAGVPTHIIAPAEKHRDQLRSTLQHQRDFPKSIQTASHVHPRNVSNPEMANGNQILLPQAGGMSVANHTNGFTKPPTQPGQPHQSTNVFSTSTIRRTSSSLSVQVFRVCFPLGLAVLRLRRRRLLSKW